MHRSPRIRQSERLPYDGAIRREFLQRGSHGMLLLAITAMFGAGLLLALLMRRANPASLPAGYISGKPVVQAGAPAPTRDPAVPLIGIVSGHAGYDPGAVCPDGLTEAEVNAAIAAEVIQLLKRRGLQVDLLEEFDPRLDGYRAEALVSIHADSCSVPGASGFKAARVTESAIPVAEDKLVTCLNREYSLHTGLPQHPSSITDGMTDYHAFREIDPLTPGAIIETGFLLEDRLLLTQQPQVVARGIASGIICFLEGPAE
jgi:N-acetylmuramoyl-L-alanine amidase